MAKNFSKRTVKDFNFARKFFQYWAIKLVIMNIIRSKYNILKVEGLENIKKDKKYVVTSNHVLGFDPFFVAGQLNLTIAYMAKKELFETFWSRLLMDWCGAFSVDRDKVDVSTIKTALTVKNTSWHLGIFPQGTRCNNGKLENINKGFINIAKKMNVEILPVGIILRDNKNTKTSKKELLLRVGEPILVNNSPDKILEIWGNAIGKLSGLQYIPA